MKILALRNNCKLTTEDEARLASALIKLSKATPFEYEVTWKDISFPQVYKSFDDTSLVKGLYGLDGAKQKIRDLGIMKQGEFDIVMHFYEAMHPFVAYWTFPTDILGAVYIEVPISQAWDSLEKAICHEMIHAFHRMLNWKGIKSEDTMDEVDIDKDGDIDFRYDGDNVPMTGTNYQRNLKELSKYWEYLRLPKIITLNTKHGVENVELIKTNYPQYIIIHHTAGVKDTFKSVKVYHISKGWGDIGYHYFIDRDGIEHVGREEDEVGTHCIADGMNFKSIGICLSGNFETEKPTEKQLATMNNILYRVQGTYDIPDTNILYHGQVKGASTLCCGKHLITYLDNRKRTIIIRLALKVIELLKKLK